MRYQVSSKEHDGSCLLLLKAPYIHTSYKENSLSFIVQYACVVNIVIIIGIFSLIELKYVFLNTGAPGRHPIPRDRATAPSPTHTAALAIPGERTASQPNSGSGDFSKLPSQSRQVITTLSVGSTVERSTLDRASVQSSCLCVKLFAFFSAVVVLLHFSCTHMVGSWVVLVDGLFCCTLPY